MLHFVLADVYPSESGSSTVLAVRDTGEEDSQALTFHGIILRSQLVTLLKRGVFYSENIQVNSFRSTGIDIIWIISPCPFHKSLCDFVLTEMFRGKAADSTVCQRNVVSCFLSVILHQQQEPEGPKCQHIGIQTECCRPKSSPVSLCGVLVQDALLLWYFPPPSSLLTMRATWRNAEELPAMEWHPVKQD